MTCTTVITQKGLTIKNLSTPYFGGSSNFLFESLFCGVPCFKQQDKIKVMIQFTTVNTNPIRNGRLLRLEKW